MCMLKSISQQLLWLTNGELMKGPSKLKKILKKIKKIKGGLNISFEVLQQILVGLAR